jgi:hypothetical protein
MRIKQTERNQKAKRAALAVTAAAMVFVWMVSCSQQRFGLVPGAASFSQKASFLTDVDILWVIDTSGSMAPRQEGLAAQVGPFVEKLNATRLNYHMAVTTMDMSASGEKGRFLAQAGTPTVLTAQTPDLVATLQARIKAGASGSLLEKGMEAVKTALSAPVVTGANAGFLRANSLLVVIFLSDENDKSTVFDDVAFFNSIHAPLPFGDKSWVVQFLGVTPTDPTCQTTAWGYSDPGTRYIDLANASGGAAESICDNDFGRALTNVNRRLTALLVEFPLDRKPLVSTIQVTVDGMIIEQSNVDGWSYFEPNNSIRFHGTAVPAPDSTIHVDFEPEGLK